MKHNAQSEWTRLDGLRRGFINRCEKYANYTLPRLCTVNGYNQNNSELSHDWQSIGAQATNHVVNKLVLALFAPSRPFFRLEADPDWKRTAVAQGIKESVIDEALAKAERDAIREMDSKGTVRPKLYQALANLVVLGNVMVYLPKDKKADMRVFGIKSYVARRTGEGKLKTALIRECLKFDELEPDVQDYCNANGMRKGADAEVQFFRWIERTRDGKYRMTQWVDTTKLPQEYDGFWPEEKLPYRVLTWQLADENDYGTGLVEDYAGDFASISALSEAQVKGAILASEFRWLVNPGGMTKPEDLESSENGAVLPGLKDDVVLVANSKPGDLQVVQAIGADYLRRIGQGFLMGSAVTRDAERVTAQEIRLQAQELETSFGGTYSRIAVDMQAPIADWLLLSVELDLSRTKLKRSIVTGLDALSRSGDLDALRAALADIAQIGNLPPEQLAILNLDAINSTIFIGHGLSGDKFVKSTEVQAQEAKARQDQQQAMVAQQAGADAAAQQITQGQPAQ